MSTDRRVPGQNLNPAPAPTDPIDRIKVVDEFDKRSRNQLGATSIHAITTGILGITAYWVQQRIAAGDTLSLGDICRSEFGSHFGLDRAPDSLLNDTTQMLPVFMAAAILFAVIAAFASVDDAVNSQAMSSAERTAAGRIAATV